MFLQEKYIYLMYLVVYFDLYECVIVPQSVDQGLDPDPRDEVRLQVQTLQRLVLSQHFPERLRERGSYIV